MGTVASIGAAGMSGVQQYGAAKAEKQNAKLERQFEKTQAAEEENARAKQLSYALQQNEAAFAYAGIDASSGTALRQNEQLFSVANRQGGMADSVSRAQQAQLRNKGIQAGRRGTAYLLNSGLAGTSLLSTRGR
ncbi:MAG: hypothetical protein CMF62_06380 [Magnetococcales bacterium]|nr:hypothetical protein [Magnetococcales bacterium]